MVGVNKQDKVGRVGLPRAGLCPVLGPLKKIFYTNEGKYFDMVEKQGEIEEIY